eukprot:GHRR01018006.1.p1 GENE.GHRR01018006.1~~GHRR01018006.1.p1  ORF type:complete len:270 (+),score=77.20 GHRR01018006.1:27-836(+)
MNTAQRCLTTRQQCCHAFIVSCCSISRKARHAATRRQRQRAAVVQLAGLSSEQGPENPWSFGFQTNERYLQWDQSAQIALVKIWLAEKLQLPQPQVEERLGELGNLLPDLVGKMERARADILYELLKDPTATAQRLLALREVLPRCNVSALVAGYPTLMLGMKVLHCCRPCALLAADYSLWALLMQIEEVQQQVRQMRRKLPGVDVDALIAQEPMLLRADLPRLMSELARLLPNADPVKFISSNPQMVLGMDAAGMPSTLEIEGMPSTW